MPHLESRNIFTRPYGFWFYQITGWGLYAFYDFYINIFPEKNFSQSFDRMYFVYWFTSILFAFCLTLVLRTIFKSIYQKLKNPVFHIIFLLIVTLLASIFWQIFSNLIAFLKIFDYPSIFNGSREIKSYYVFARMFLLSWPLFVWSILYFLIKSRQDFFAEKEKAIQSQLLAKDAQLQALRYQINPHFLFNALVSIQGLITHKASLADKMIAELSEFLRYTLQFNHSVFVPFGQEIDIIDKYLSIEKVRFGDKLTFRLSITQEARNQVILCFLLQPLIENSIKYGLQSCPESVVIILETEVIDNWLSIKIRNTGSFIGDQYKEGTGISNVKERLNNAYSGKHSFEIVSDNGWVVVHITINQQ
ncbi:sensor histidine kinase [Bacteroidota bacterium]